MFLPCFWENNPEQVIIQEQTISVYVSFCLEKMYSEANIKFLDHSNTNLSKHLNTSNLHLSSFMVEVPIK